MITLKQMRTDAGLSVKDVAGKLKVSPQMIYMWEAGTRGLPAITLQQMCEVYNLPLISLNDIVLPDPPSRSRKQNISTPQ